ncbi:MAG: 4Fe-4S binding protein [bacterium]
MPASVSREKCTGCSGRDRKECVHVCAYEAITAQDGKAVVDEAKCDDCRMCVEACPVQAIITV